MLTPISPDTFRHLNEQRLALQPGKGDMRPGSIKECVGGDYDHYVRILHPFSSQPIRWRQRLHENQRLNEHTRGSDLEGADPEALPVTGVLDVPTSRVMSRVLFAAAPNRRSIVGFHESTAFDAEFVDPADRGSIEMTEYGGDNYRFFSDQLHMVPYVKSLSPTLIWPTSGAWGLAVEVAGYATYLGCTNDTYRQLRDLEALEIIDVPGDAPRL